MTKMRNFDFENGSTESAYAYETFYTKALEYKEYFTHISFQEITPKFRIYSTFSHFLV